MGWRPEDVLRLMGYKLDFVAVAGPRKVHPPSFAVTSQDDLGNPLPIRVDATTGLLEVTGVGMAFVLISKHCAERMCQHYADLTYVTADGREVVGVFMPAIINRRRRSEDFMFCQRLRAIGVRIMVDADISLQHYGSYVWEGAWINHLEQMQRAREAAA